ncbi:hypothetical protein D0U04_27235 [Bacillus clarus]|uniref:Uncharacterized protein n=1 Tax=Bacillus clarus TaxID=2338372 RepID=A0ABX9KN51_9BACI|nr:hypothetical protein D0U04_27235 [Bacillus clarus]
MLLYHLLTEDSHLKEWIGHGSLHVLLEMIVFGSGVVVLYQLKHYMLVSGLAIVVVMNWILMLCIV